MAHKVIWLVTMPLRRLCASRCITLRLAIPLLRLGCWKHAVGLPAADRQSGGASVPIAAMQSATTLQGKGVVSSVVPAHRSGTGSDLLSPGAALERMDAAAPPRVLESTPQNLTVGIRDAGLGWIEIRTHAIAGQVAATLASGTHEAHAAIAAELPAIRDTLTNQHVAVHSLGAERFPTSSGGGSAGRSSDEGGRGYHSPVPAKGNAPSVQSEAEAENLSYISVRV
jgi:hypothetical protein